MAVLRKNQNGMALLLVLVIITLLTSLLMELSYSTLVDQRLTETFRDSTKAYYLAKGGIAAGRMLLKADKNDYDSTDELWHTGIINYPVGQGAVSVAITDLDGKLAINELVNGNNPQTVVVDRFYRLFSSLEIEHLADPAELVAALIDWLDSGNQNYQLIQTDGLDIPVSGAENDYYQGLANGYSCKNGPLESMDELLLVKGFSQEVVNIVAPYLTVNGSNKININTASDKVLLSLSAQLDEQTIEVILEHRQDGPIEKITELESLLADEAYSIVKSLANQELLGTESRYYRIDSEAMVNDGRQRLVAEVDKKNNQLLFIRVE